LRRRTCSQPRSRWPDGTRMINGAQGCSQELLNDMVGKICFVVYMFIFTTYKNVSW
jgi:hypothetical protein